jgi:hypothetical protein
LADRLTLWLYQIVISIDQLAHVVCGGPKYLAMGGPCPSADETISSKVGRSAIAGKKWALITEVVINALLGPNHCRRMIER